MYLNNLNESKQIPSTLVKFKTKKKRERNVLGQNDEGEYAVIL